MASENVSRTFRIGLIVAIICSFVVSSSFTLLKGIQDKNRRNFRNKNVLIAAGIYNPNKSIEEQFKNIKTYYYNLESQKIVKDSDVDKYFRDFNKIVNNQGTSIKLTKEEDLASIGRIPKKIPIYFIQKENKIDKVIIPIYGKGLWSTMYGFLAVESDGKTAAGITFYEHGETPGLGGQVDNLEWKKQWAGKKLYDNNWNVIIEVIHGEVDKSSKESIHQVDGLSGASMTTRGVNNLVRFWLSEEGFKSLFRKLSHKEVKL